jgi:hypothetical protein
MRKDMHKLIVERERLGGREEARSVRRAKHGDLSGLPRHEGMRKPHRVRRSWKQLNENLAPLKRYLRKQVGRPWNAVYREISRELRPSSAVQQHVRGHLWDFVHRHVVLGEAGAVFLAPHVRPEWPRQLFEGDLYVHPENGLLAAVKPWRKPGRKRPGKKR